MKPIVKQWIAKAEGDLDVARLLARPRPRTSYGSACFHAYECVDKYMKAILAQHGVRFRLTLPLIETFERLVKRLPEWGEFRASAEFLNQFDQSILYPGRSACRAEARAAARNCRAIRERARRTLGLTAAEDRTGKRRTGQTPRAIQVQA